MLPKPQALVGTGVGIAKVFPKLASKVTDFGKSLKHAADLSCKTLGFCAALIPTSSLPGALPCAYVGQARLPRANALGSPGGASERGGGALVVKVVKVIIVILAVIVMVVLLVIRVIKVIIAIRVRRVR